MRQADDRRNRLILCNNIAENFKMYLVFFIFRHKTGLKELEFLRKLNDADPDDTNSLQQWDYQHTFLITFKYEFHFAVQE
jgi:hypothetical protein